MLACHNYKNVGGSDEVPGSETKNFITHDSDINQSFIFTCIIYLCSPRFYWGNAKSLSWMLAHKTSYDTEEECWVIIEGKNMTVLYLSGDVWEGRCKKAEESCYLIYQGCPANINLKFPW